MKVRTFLPGLVGFGLLATVGAVAADELRGVIRISSGRPGNAADPRQAVVYFEPAALQAASRPSREAVMTTRGKEFEPLVLAVDKGSAVRFPNEDPILHNVFSVSPGNAFDLGLYSRGPGETRVLDQPGVVRVFCNVHQSMVGYVLVLDTPHYTSPDSQGSFRLGGVPAGGGRLTAWHPQTEPREVRVPAGAAGPFEVLLMVTRERVPSHLNKFGKSYQRGRRGRYD